MRNNNSMLYSILLVVGDFFALVIAFLAAYFVRVEFDDRPLVDQIPGDTYIRIFVLLFPFWLIVFGMLGLYTREVYEKRFTEITRLLVGSIIGILIIIAYDFVSTEPIFPARLVAVYGLILGASLLILERIILWNIRRKLFTYGWGVSNVMLVGSTEATSKLAKLLNATSSSGYRIVAIVGNKSAVPYGFEDRHYRSINEALENLDSLGIDTIIQTEFFDEQSKNRKILEAAQMHHLAYRLVPAYDELFAAKHTVELFHDYPVIAVHNTPLIGWGRVIKRIFDIIFSVVGIIVLSPVFVFIIILMKLREPTAPILFKHKRVTRFGEEFYIYKFRSMLWKYSTGGGASGKTDAQVFKAMGREDLIEEFKEHQKVANDPRITPLGKFLRASSLDELPQLFNAFTGKISLVGPRPIVRAELERYKSAGPIFLSVKPGITGLWQVSGRSDISYDERVKIDTFYIRNWSFWLDIKILLKTIVVVIRKTGAR